MLQATILRPVAITLCALKACPVTPWFLNRALINLFCENNFLPVNIQSGELGSPPGSPWAPCSPGSPTPPCSSSWRVVSRHAVTIEVIYALVWEGLIGGYVPGARRFSIQQWAQSIADQVTTSAFLKSEVALKLRRPGHGDRRGRIGHVGRSAAKGALTHGGRVIRRYRGRPGGRGAVRGHPGTPARPARTPLHRGGTPGPLGVAPGWSPASPGAALHRPRGRRTLRREPSPTRAATSRWRPWRPVRR